VFGKCSERELHRQSIRVSHASEFGTGCGDPRGTCYEMPLERHAANLLFALVSRRYERGSIVVTSNRSFEQWAETLGDAMVAAR
jgi:hypothetical protein